MPSLKSSPTANVGGMQSPSGIETLLGAETGATYIRAKGPRQEGGMKYVSFTSDGKFAIAEYKQGNADFRRLSAGLDELLAFRRTLTSAVRQYWERIFIWPIERISTSTQSLAFVMPAIPCDFYVKASDFKDFNYGKVKEDKHDQKRVAEFTTIERFDVYRPEARGSFAGYFKMCADIARSIRFINRWGRSYGDISLNNILINPSTASVVFIDMDNMTVNHAKGRTTVGTPGYLAPEIYFDGERATNKTDDFSLAVMLYKILHLRHPFLRNPFSQDNEAQDYCEGGEKKPARSKNSFVYIESEKNKINRYSQADVLNYMTNDCLDYLQPYCFPWFDLDRLPSRKVVGERMAELFRKTFEDYLYDPDNRPTAEEWEKNIIRTEGRLLPCANSDCPAGAFIWDEYNYDHKMNRFVCPFCGTPLLEQVFTMSVIEHSDNNRWKWIIATPTSKTRPILRWEMGGFDAANRSKLIGDQLEDESLTEPVAEIYYSGNRFRLRNFSGTDLIFVRNNERKILSDGESIELVKNDAFYKVTDRVFLVRGIVG